MQERAGNEGCRTDSKIRDAAREGCRRGQEMRDADRRDAGQVRK